MNELLELSQKIGAILTKNKLLITTAESCTGGQLAEIITAIPGSSNYFDRGFVTYSNAAKQEMLGLDKDLIDKAGAVSEQVVNAMAANALKKANAQISIAISGIAGPGGGSQEKPVGLVWLAWGFVREKNKIEISACRYQFAGSRLEIRAQAVKVALQKLLDKLSLI